MNFSDARGRFFSEAVAPFVFMHVAAAPDDEGWSAYLTVRRSRSLATTGSLAHASMDRRLVRQGDVQRRDYLWKTYAWGSHHDASLLGFFDAQTSLGEFLQSRGLSAGCGWQQPWRRASIVSPAFIASVPALDVNKAMPCEPLDETLLEDAPARVAYPTRAVLYHGQRLVVTRHTFGRFGPYPRLESRAFSFTHSAYGIPLQSVPQWQAKIILAILLSSLGRYRLFMTRGRWATWYDEVTQGQLLELPVRFPPSARDNTARALIGAVDAVRAFDGAMDASLFSPDGPDRLNAALSRIDDLVFELFGLTPAQRDVIQDFHAIHLGAEAGGPADTAARVELNARSRGGRSDGRPTKCQARHTRPLSRRLSVCVESRAARAGFSAVGGHRSDSPDILCVVFNSTAATGMTETADSWRTVLERLGPAVSRPVTQSLFVEAVVRGVTDSHLVIVKREFVVECKRLGHTPGATNFDHDYVADGVARSSH